MQGALGEIEVVQVDVEARPVCPEVFFGIFEQEGGFAHAPGTFDADESPVPVDLLHQLPFYGRVGVLYQVFMCPEKRLHCFYLDFGEQRYKRMVVLQSGDCKFLFFLFAVLVCPFKSWPLFLYGHLLELALGAVENV